ncbi:MAG: putative O-glycosylation ligase, exosortase A system-associated [Gammaproteobacteria bacterium]|nr:putative O-glycosylation ligase, exosortase A system-associated [Gammaproteobacteria bacterium]
MRDILVTLIVFGSLPFILRRPWIGIMMWNWLAYMNPHRLSWGFAFDFPFAQVVAIATIFGFFFTTERRYIGNGVVLAWAMLCIWVTVTTFFALDQESGWDSWEKMMKIQLFTALTVMLVSTRERIETLIWVIVLSLGFFGVKGGLFVLRTAGENLVWGPPGSFIHENNALALALIMTIPLMWHLYTQATRRSVRWGLLGMIVLTAAAVLGSHSRGAALAGTGMLAVLWLKSAQRLRLGLAILLVFPVLLSVMPEKYFDRIESITSFEQDGSALGRLRAWRVAIEIAIQRPVVGAGFNSVVEENYRRFAPQVAQEVDQFSPGHFSDAHSIYFKVLGDHGFVGLAVYLLFGWLSYDAAGRVRAQTGNREDLQWAGSLGAMLQVSMAGFAIGGAFLSLSYFDYFYCLVAIVVTLQIYVRDALASSSEGVTADSRPADAVPRPAA